MPYAASLASSDAHHEGCARQAHSQRGAWERSGHSVLRHRAVILCLSMWSWSHKLCNMHLERLLSLIRKSAKLRCYVERLLHAGFLTQVLQRHLKAGGTDIRKITRRMLDLVNAPVKARAKKKSRQERQVLIPARRLHIRLRSALPAVAQPTPPRQLST